MRELGLILKDISAFEGSPAFTKLQARWDADLDLFRLKPYDAGAGYYSYTSNSPRLLANHIITKLSEAKLLLRVPEDIMTNDERDIASNNERLVMGAIAKYNDLALNDPNGQTLSTNMAWLSAMRGGYALRVWVYKDNDGETQLDIKVWDLYNMRYGYSPDGVPWAAHKYTITKQEAKDIYDITTTKDVLNVYDIYDDKENGISADGKWVKSPQPHGRNYTPVWILKAGHIPKVDSGTFSETDVLRGESILANNRGLYPMMNKLYSDYFTIVRRGVKTPMGYWSTTGKKILEGDIWQVEKAASVPLQVGEKIEPILPPTMPADAAAVVNILVGEEQRGGLSHVAMGDLGFRLSGYAISQLKESIEEATIASLQTMERGYQLIARELLRQFGEGHWKAVEVKGRTSKGQMFGVPKAIKISPKDVEPAWVPEVRLSPVLPRDDAQRYELAVMATQGDRPILSTDTARDMLIELPDPKLEQNKIDNEYARALPTNRLFQAYVGALAMGNKVEAANVLAELQKYMMAMPGAAGLTGGTAPSNVSGVSRASSAVVPEETRGGVPPGVANAKQPPSEAEEL